jgi:hypothetical protein
MPIPLIIWGIAAAGGAFVGGALSRQPEINRLRDQVDILQQEVERLQREVERLQILVEEQDRQIKVLVMKYHTMRGINFIQKAKAKNQARGAIMYTYCLKEYLELKNSILTKEYDPNDYETTFLDTFGKVLEGRMEEDNKGKAKLQFIKEYIRSKFARQIDAMEDCNLENALRRIELYEVA